MEPTKITDLEKIYSHLARRLKLKNKELDALKKEKFAALSQGEEREVYVKIIAKEAEIYTIRQEIEFMDTGSIELPEEKKARLEKEEKDRLKKNEEEKAKEIEAEESLKEAILQTKNQEDVLDQK